MSVRNIKVRFNLDKENDRRAYEYLKESETSYSKAVISAICRYMVLTVEDLMPILSIGRNTAYELIRSGQIRSVRAGRKIRVPKEAIAEYLSR